MLEPLLFFIIGFYMFIETSSPRKDGDKAVLFTPVIKAGSKCLTFFYHMYGPHIDTLRVYVTSNNRSLGSPIWSKTGTQGNVWKNMTLTVSNVSDFQVNNIFFIYIVKVTFSVQICYWESDGQICSWEKNHLALATPLNAETCKTGCSQTILNL